MKVEGDESQCAAVTSCYQGRKSKNSTHEHPADPVVHTAHPQRQILPDPGKGPIAGKGVPRLRAMPKARSSMRELQDIFQGLCGCDL